MAKHQRENDYAMIGSVGVVLFNEIFFDYGLPFRNWLRKTNQGWVPVAKNETKYWGSKPGRHRGE